MRESVRRIVEFQSGSVLRKMTDSSEEFGFIEDLVERTKRAIPATDHHYLIRTPYRYPLPVLPRFAARFTPPFSGRHCSYYAFRTPTTVYEYAYHWLRQRAHVDTLSQEPQPRTYFETKYSDAKAVDLRRHRDVRRIMQRGDYSHSHAWIARHPQASSVIYPSCRDPERGDCAAIFDIGVLGKTIRNERTLYFIYQSAQKSCLVLDALHDGEKTSLGRFEVSWDEVS